MYLVDTDVVSEVRKHANPGVRRFFADARARGDALYLENAIDKQIGATALTHGLTLVTRNTAHFSGLGMTLVNPFV